MILKQTPKRQRSHIFMASKEECTHSWIHNYGPPTTRHLLLEKEMASHSSIVAWRIPWMEEPGGLQSMESQRVGHD